MTTDKQHKILNVPPLRFPEFTGEYVKHTLGEMGTGLIGLTYSPKNVVNEGGKIVFRSSNIQDGQIDYSDIVRVDMKIKDSILTQKDDLLICARNGSPRLIGKNALLTEKEEGQTFGAFMLVYRSNDNSYIHKLLNTKRYITQVGENLGARINQITSANLGDFEFYFPQAKEERNKIANFLNLIDQRISTQNKIIEDLKTLKIAIIEKSYNCCGDMRKIGDLIIQMSKRNKQNKYPVLSVNNRLGFIEQADQFEDRTVASEDTSNYKVVSHNDFAYNPARINVGSIARLKDRAHGIVSPMYVCFHTKERLSPDYFEFFFDTTYFKHEMFKRLEGSVRLCLSYEGLCNIPIYVPSLDEQRKLSNRISAIEQKIRLESKLLDTYKRQKMYLLHQMFI